MSNDKIQNILSSIDRNLEIGDFNSSVFQCGIVFEIIFKQIIKESMSTLPFNIRKSILEMETQIGKGNKGFDDFTLGQIVGLLRETKLISIWAKHLNKDLGILQSIDISPFIELRNEASHSNSSVIIDENGARLFHTYLLNWLAFLGIQNIKDNIKKTFEPEPIEASLPKSKTSIEKVTSSYTPALLSEEERLKIQSNSTLLLDLKVFKNIFEIIGKNNLVVLDFGCASGRVIYDRFKDIQFVSKVIGIDINSDVIDKANKLYGNEKFSFHNIDISNKDGLTKFKALLQLEGIEQFDLIYTSYVLHHLENPKKVLSILRGLLKENGSIFIKAADDQSKICYPHGDLANDIINIQSSMPTSSDRFFPRKLYKLLLETGYKNINYNYEVIDTVGKSYDEKYNMFLDDFSYRKNYVMQAIEKDPDNKKLKENYEFIERAQEELMDSFTDYDFYYSNTVTVVVAYK